MSPNEQGAFCNKCVKTVIDFTGKSLDEIKSFFAGRGQESTCGRFEETQLSALSFDAFFERFRKFEFTKRFAVILFFTFGLCLFGVSPAAAQSDSLANSDTTVKQQELAWPAATFTNIILPHQNGQIINTLMGTVSNIQTHQVFDWAEIPEAHPVFVMEPVKKAAVRPVTLKRKPVDRRRD